MKLARVFFTDMDRIEHAVTVEARSMFHAVGLAIVRFRSFGVGDPGPLTRFTVEARESATEHTVTQKQFEEWLERTGGSPADVAQRSDLKALLKETEPPDLARARKPRFH